MNWALAVQLGLASTLLQLWLCLLMSVQATVLDSYLAFSNWDGEWFLSILENGYISSLPPKRLDMLDSNVAFFPGYPIWSWLVSKALFLRDDLALPVASQLAAAVFWILFYAALMRTGARWSRSIAVLFVAGLALAIHSGAFFLQMAYSESLFLASLFGYLLTVREKRLWPLAALSGIVLSSTRIVGLPIVLVCGWLSMDGWSATGLKSDSSGWSKRWSAKIPQRSHQFAVSIVASLGGLAFFAYCAIAFGHWDLYMWTQKIGWGIKAKPLAALAPASWLQWPGFGFAATDMMPLRVDPNIASRVFTSVYLWTLAATAVLEFALYRSRVRKTVQGEHPNEVGPAEDDARSEQKQTEREIAPATAFRARLPFYAAAVIVMAVSLSGVYSVAFKSMTRYTFAVHACWLVGFIGLYRELPLRWQILRHTITALALIASLYALILQLRFIGLFTRYLWVA